MGRSSWQRGALVVCVGLGLACDPGGAATPAAAPVDPLVLQAHVLSRIGYGPDAWTLARIDSLGVTAYIEEQLDPARIPEPEIDARLADVPALQMSFHDLMETYPLNQPGLRQPVVDLMRLKLLRSILGRRQLEQVLVDFWFDHFNVYGLDALTIHGVIPYERDVIRPGVLGRFEDMLLGVARSPAMLYYLDNFRSSRDGFEFGDEIRGLNENYARELLELHTLGVDGGYDQQDVIEVARAFTGWTIAPRAIAGADGYFFWPDAHDDAEKSLMGDLLLRAGGGETDGEAVIAYLAAHPSTAHFLCSKLVTRFVDENPPDTSVNRCQDTYLASDGDLREVMRSILLSPDFLDPARAGAKVKRPLHWASSLARTTGLDVDYVLDSAEGEPITPIEALVYYLQLLGEPVYQAHPPTGYPDESLHWASGGSLVTRFGLVSLIAGGDVVLDVDWGATGGGDAALVHAVSQKLLPGGVRASTRDATLAHLSQYPLAPDALRVREAGALLLSSPDFMRH
jgi:uncharacterized protein (DUF1800 family)